MTVVEFVEVHKVAFGVTGLVAAISYMFRQVLREAGNYIWSLFWELAFPFRSFDKVALGGFTRWMVESGARCARNDNPGEIQWTFDRWVVSEGRRRCILSQTREPQPGYYLFRGAVLKVGDNYLRWVRGTFDADRALRDYEAWQVAFEEKRRKPGSAIPSADRVPGFEVRRYTGSTVKGDHGFEAAREMRKALSAARFDPAPSTGADNPPASGGTDFDLVPVFLDPEDVKNFDPTVNPFEDYVESPESRQVRRYFRFWLEQEHWHREHRVPWRLGVLLYGLPGTGKTSLVRCLAQEANCRVAVLDLSAMEAQEFDGVMQSIRLWLGAGILLIEDVDCTFEGRENIRGGGGVTLDQLLNFLDGVDGLEGIATFITTNHVEKLDPALIRDGRVDVRVELPAPDAAGKRRIASRIVDDPEVVEELVREGADLGAAAFTGLCTRRARDMRWSVLSEGGES